MNCKYCGSENTEIRQVRREVLTDEDNPQNAEKIIYTVDCNQCGSVSEYLGITSLVQQYVDQLLQIKKDMDDCPTNCPIVYGWNYVLCHRCGKTPPPPKFFTDNS